MASWLNRDLGIAGRAVFADAKGNIREDLVRLDKHPVVIPQLAIHLDREVNEKGLVLNKQEHLAALVGIGSKKSMDNYIEKVLKKALKIKHLLAFDLFLFPLEQARFFGEDDELIASYRIDNLASTYAVLHGLTDPKQAHKDRINMAVFWDNEEIGSNTAQGAGSPFLLHVIERISLALDIPRETYFQWFHKSLCASVDLGHALHPGYRDKHEPHHIALLNKGILIKSSAQNRYASDARSSAAIVDLCRKHKIPFQKYVSRGDIPCGTTVGPIHANRTGMPTVDVGIAQLSMHACREIMGTKDHEALCHLMTAFCA